MSDATCVDCAHDRLLSALAPSAQPDQPNAPGGVLARLAYRNTFYESQGVSHAICFAVYEDDACRLLKITDRGELRLRARLTRRNGRSSIAH